MGAKKEGQDDVGCCKVMIPTYSWFSPSWVLLKLRMISEPERKGLKIEMAIIVQEMMMKNGTL